MGLWQIIQVNSRINGKGNKKCEWLEKRRMVNNFGKMLVSLFGYFPFNVGRPDNLFNGLHFRHVDKHSYLDSLHWSHSGERRRFICKPFKSFYKVLFLLPGVDGRQMHAAHEKDGFLKDLDFEEYAELIYVSLMISIDFSIPP